MLSFGKNLLTAAIAAVALGSLVASSAQANTITLDYQFASITATPGVNQFVYFVKLSSGSSLQTAAPTSGVTAYDIGGFVNATFTSATPATFAVSTPLTGGFGETAGITDSGTATNVSLTYTDNGGAGPFPTSTNLGTLTIFSSLGFTSLTRNVTVGSTDIAPDDAGPQRSNTTTFGPSANGTPVAPLPGAVAGGAALFGMLAAGRLRRKTATV